MAKRRPSVQKRNKEAKNHEKKLAKAARKAQRDAERETRPDTEDGVDPDLEGIVPGPQPVDAEPWDDGEDHEAA